MEQEGLFSLSALQPNLFKVAMTLKARYLLCQSPADDKRCEDSIAMSDESTDVEPLVDNHVQQDQFVLQITCWAKGRDASIDMA